MEKEVLQVINKVEAFINENKLINKGDTVIVALSGGADSVCLFVMLAKLKERYGISLYAVHVNHGIRGDEALRDREFAVSLAAQYGVECTVYNYDVPKLAAERKMTEEEAGRYARYEAFEQERIKRNADSIALAHHMNDQIETILFRMCRGTGIRGMQGIPVKRDYLIRPLMCLSRREIEEYLACEEQDYVNDSTNEVLDYDRNRVRNIIVPELEKINASAVEHICRLSGNIEQLYEWYETECSMYYDNMVIENEDNMYGKIYVFSCDRMACLPDIIATEIIRKIIGKLTNSMKDIENRHIKGILGLMNMESGKEIHLPYSLVAEHQYGYIRIYKKNDKSQKNKKNQKNKENQDDHNNKENNTPEKGQQDSVCTIEPEKLKAGEIFTETFYNVYLPETAEYMEKLTITAEYKNITPDMDKLPKNLCTKWIDCDKMEDKLAIRRPQDGDYLYIGNSARKKLSRYMIDNKIPRQYRDSLLIFAEGNNALYIAGGRMGRRCYVDENSNHIIEINLIGVENCEGKS